MTEEPSLEGGVHEIRKGCAEGAHEVASTLKAMILASPSLPHPYRFSSCPSACLPPVPVNEKLLKNETLKVCLNALVDIPSIGS